METRKRKLATKRTYELLIDIDKERFPSKEFNQKILFLKHFDFRLRDTKIYKTINGYHVYIIIESKFILLPERLNFLQLYLGSDWRRELRNFHRNLYLWSWRENNILFKKSELRKVGNPK